MASRDGRGSEGGRTDGRGSDARRSDGRRVDDPGGEGRDREWKIDDRGAAPVAGKALEIAIVVLYVAMLTSALYGGLLPEYRSLVGAELGERALAEAAGGVENAVPATAAGRPRSNQSATRIEADVDLPGRLRGAAYRIRAANGSTLVLDHPRDGIGGRIRPALPESVASVTGEWYSGGRTVVRVERRSDGVHVELVTR